MEIAYVGIRSEYLPRMMPGPWFERHRSSAIRRQSVEDAVPDIKGYSEPSRYAIDPRIGTISKHINTFRHDILKSIHRFYNLRIKAGTATSVAAPLLLRKP